MGLPFLPTVKLFVSKVAATSIKLTSSPIVGDAGNVAVITFEVVSIK